MLVKASRGEWALVRRMHGGSGPGTTRSAALHQLVESLRAAFKTTSTQVYRLYKKFLTIEVHYIHAHTSTRLSHN
jgi:hypothetical protein